MQNTFFASYANLHKKVLRTNCLSGFILFTLRVGQFFRGHNRCKDMFYEYAFIKVQDLILFLEKKLQEREKGAGAGSSPS